LDFILFFFLYLFILFLFLQNRLKEKNNAVGTLLISNKRLQWVGSSNEIGVEMFIPQIKSK